MKVYCKRCDNVLTNELSPCTIDIKELLEHYEPLVPSGKFILSNGSLPQLFDKTIVINNEDIINYKPHWDKKHFNGCCGNDGYSGITHICAHCNNEVATESNDCYTLWMIWFAIDKVVLK